MVLTVVPTVVLAVVLTVVRVSFGKACVFLTLSCATVQVLAAVLVALIVLIVPAVVLAAVLTASAQTLLAAWPCASPINLSFFFSSHCMVVFAWRSSPSCRLGRRYSRQHSTRRLSAQAQNISAGASEALPCLPITPPNSTSQKPSGCTQTSNSSMTTSRHVSRTLSTGGREERALPRNRKKVCWFSFYFSCTPSLTCGQTKQDGPLGRSGPKNK